MHRLSLRSAIATAVLSALPSIASANTDVMADPNGNALPLFFAIIVGGVILGAIAVGYVGQSLTKK